MAGLVDKLENWEFSSFRDFAGIRNDKLVNKELAQEIIELDWDNFYEQSSFIVEEKISRKFC